MLTLIGGIVSMIIGLIGLIYWWSQFLTLIQALVPLALILGGLLAVYLGAEEWKEETSAAADKAQNSASNEVERYHAQAEAYKKELEDLQNAMKDEEAQNQ